MVQKSCKKLSQYKVLIFMSIGLLMSNCYSNDSDSDFNIQVKKINEKNLKLTLTFYGPLDIYWDSNVLSHYYNTSVENELKLNSLRDYNLNKNQIIIENKNGEMRFFSDIPVDIEYEIVSHYIPLLPEKFISLGDNETEKLEFIIPYSKKHFAISKATIGQEIRLNYIYATDSLQSFTKKNRKVLKSNWIKWY